MEAPFLYKGKEALNVSADAVFATVKSIVEAGREEEFLKVCKERGAVVTVAPVFVNLVKSYLFETGIHKMSLRARSVVDSNQCEPSG
jgi:hypothetical protein